MSGHQEGGEGEAFSVPTQAGREEVVTFDQQMKLIINAAQAARSQVIKDGMAKKEAMYIEQWVEWDAMKRRFLLQRGQLQELIDRKVADINAQAQRSTTQLITISTEYGLPNEAEGARPAQEEPNRGAGTNLNATPSQESRMTATSTPSKLSTNLNAPWTHDQESGLTATSTPSRQSLNLNSPWTHSQASGATATSTPPGQTTNVNTTQSQASGATATSTPFRPSTAARARSLPSSISEFEENIQRRVASKSAQGTASGSDWLLTQPRSVASASRSSNKSTAPDSNKSNPYLGNAYSIIHRDLPQASRYNQRSPVPGFQDNVAPDFNHPSTRRQMQPGYTGVQGSATPSFNPAFSRTQSSSVFFGAPGYVSPSFNPSPARRGPPLAIAIPSNTGHVVPSTSSVPAAVPLAVMQGVQQATKNPKPTSTQPSNEQEAAEQAPGANSTQSDQILSTGATPRSTQPSYKRPRADTVSEDESEAGLTSKPALASQAPLQSSDTEGRKAPASRREVKEGEIQGFVTKMIGYLPPNSSPALDVTWYDGIQLRLNYVKQSFEPYLGIEKRTWVCRDMVVDDSWVGKVFYNQRSARFEAYRKNGARLRVQFRSADDLGRFMLYYKPMFEDRVQSMEERYEFVGSSPKSS